MTSNAIETLIGTLVLVIAGGFLYFAYSIGDRGGVDGYRVVAFFERADGIGVGTDVRVSGVKVGSVTAQELDTANYLARVVMTIDPKVQIPSDSAVKVASDGLLGNSYLAIQIGGSEAAVADGGELTNTQPAIDVMGLIGQAIFSASPGAKEEGAAAAPQP